MKDIDFKDITKTTQCHLKRMALNPECFGTNFMLFIMQEVTDRDQ